MNSPMTHPCDPTLVPSWIVRRKVYEFSGLLPDTLKFELVPHGDILSERYIALAEFMHSKDLVMRTLINDVELLTCIHSPDETTSTSCGDYFAVERGSNKVIDMEIDMIVGENVGTLDILIMGTPLWDAHDDHVLYKIGFEKPKFKNSKLSEHFLWGLFYRNKVIDM
ncbi:hypothetical protein H5410_032883 [Solanum commersonii]|uniref:Uncharacterized protein n=1 Tax=Solanum commersonii TaxID=4109 RepID=A0A9J5YM86_SOLCO|nr:hypothetical protein H5410_032883 [Solanum commersonii]